MNLGLGPKKLRRRHFKFKTHCHMLSIKEWAKYNPKISNKTIAKRLNISESQASRIVCKMIKYKFIYWRTIKRTIKKLDDNTKKFTTERVLEVNFPQNQVIIPKKYLRMIDYLYDTFGKNGQYNIKTNFPYEIGLQIDRLNKPLHPLDAHIARNSVSVNKINLDFIDY